MTRLTTLKPKVKLAKQNGRTAKPVERKRGRHNQRSRERILLRDHYLCVRCHAKGLITRGDEVDHIVPLAAGGSDEDGNKQTLCRWCHTDKTVEDRNQYGWAHQGEGC